MKSPRFGCDKSSHARLLGALFGRGNTKNPPKFGTIFSTQKIIYSGYILQRHEPGSSLRAQILEAALARSRIGS